MDLSKYVASVLVGILLISCFKKNNNAILPEKDFEKVLVDLLMAENYVNGYIIKDTTKQLKQELFWQYDSVFASNNTTSKQFLNSYDYYLKNPERLKIRLDSLQMKMRNINLIPTKVSPVTKTASDTSTLPIKQVE
jgi:hypothetical protein